MLKFDQEGVEALQHNQEAAELIGAVGGWFSAEFSRSVPLLTRLFNGHITILPLLFPAPLGQPGIGGAEVTKPLWMFLWLFPAEEAWGARALAAVPGVLVLLLALVPVVDRATYMAPGPTEGAAPRRRTHPAGYRGEWCGRRPAACVGPPRVGGSE